MVRFFTLVIGVATGIFTASAHVAVAQLGVQLGAPNNPISATPPAYTHPAPASSAYNHIATAPPASDLHSATSAANNPSIINSHEGGEGGCDSDCGPSHGRLHRLGVIGAMGGVGGVKGWCGLSYFRSLGDMPPHYAYYPAMHGYYYFRPYNDMHVTSQQEFVSSFGGDRRDPYSNEFFKVIYAEFQASLREKAPEIMPGTGPALTPSTDMPLPRKEMPEIIPPPRAAQLQPPAK